MNAPSFAVVGHPNEGKSSVVSTLVENERVRVSPRPGETRRVHRYSIDLDGRAALEIFDTPGFQNPAATLAWFQAWKGPESEMLGAFLAAHADNPDFHHDVALLEPLQRRAGILYVVDPSRPLREADRQEMELLRLTGLPRLALLNAKRGTSAYREEWDGALSRRFNLVRDFNAHHASFAERLALLEAMALLVPAEEGALRGLRDRLEADGEARIARVAVGIEALLARVLSHQARMRLRADREEGPQAAELMAKYRDDLRAFEAASRAEWREVFRHESLPAGSPEAVSADLFAARVWRLLGLTRRQLAWAGATAAALVGAGADAAAGGLSFGVFTAAGALAGGLAGWFGGPRLGAKRPPFPGAGPLAREHLLVGPCRDPQVLFILLDRSLLYVLRLMNWAHGRRDHDAFLAELGAATGLVRGWTEKERGVVLRWQRDRLRGGGDPARSSAALRSLLCRSLGGKAPDPP